LAVRSALTPVCPAGQGRRLSVRVAGALRSAGRSRTGRSGDDSTASSGLPCPGLAFDLTKGIRSTADHDAKPVRRARAPGPNRSSIRASGFPRSLTSGKRSRTSLMCSRAPRRTIAVHHQLHSQASRATMHAPQARITSTLPMAHPPHPPKPCGHVGHSGTCPHCQRVQLTRWAAQLAQVRPRQ
jgi:hypothetical protein